ncbi:hypothetical protein LCGC14_0698590 [marine sediment metagenome]|uniref:Uncharacterized protein n=1 Tax=marine sediment metagenome TaxID=412755 RepID=A0A0F9QIJ5_9ZZZZ
MNKQEVLDYIYDSVDTDELKEFADVAWDCLKDLRKRDGRRTTARLTIGAPVQWTDRNTRYRAEVVKKNKTRVVCRITEAPPRARFRVDQEVAVPAEMLKAA